ncbi:MAG: DUF4412 domain-containing protein [Bacteroidales bacterium]
MIRSSIIFITLCFSFHITLKADLGSFEGEIRVVRETIYDTTYIEINVKDHMVRVDEHDSRKELVSSQIVDIEKEEVVALSHSKKLFAHVPVSPRIVDGSNELEINKTENHKEINGVICYQWRVKDVKRNTEIAYWVFEERFDFFEKLLKLLNRTEFSFSAFDAIPGREGFFPMLTEERTLLRREKLRVAVVAINEQVLNGNVFKIPENYNAVKR